MKIYKNANDTMRVGAYERDGKYIKESNTYKVLHNAPTIIEADNAYAQITA